MKTTFLTIILLASTILSAHDEGHGPAVKDESLQGGKVAAIILESDIEKGRRAKMLFKGELVYESRKPEVKLYIYTKKMKEVDLSAYSKQVEVVQIERRKEKKFNLELDKSGKFYVGARPLNKRVPFNIDVRLSKGDQKLFGAFDGLD